MMLRSACTALVLLALLVCAGLQPQPTARAETEGSVAIGCEFLMDAIDGDLSDATTPLGIDGLEACNGIDAMEVANLAAALGDEDATLEPSDFNAIDPDANQIRDAGGSIFDEIVLFAFVDNDAIVTFDAEIGVDTFVHDDQGGLSSDGDASPETCTAADDLDCDNGTLSDGDGVVVAHVQDNLAGDPGDTIDVDMFQADDTGQVSTETIHVVGAPDDITLDLLKDPISTSGDASDVTDCAENSDVTDAGQINDANRTVLKATANDDDGTELTRVWVSFEVADENVARFDDDFFEPADAPKARTFGSIDAGAAGIGMFLVLCGGTDFGTTTVTATENVNSNDASVIVNVVGLAANIALGAVPQTIDCDGVHASVVTATVTDAGGNPVANGTPVNFLVTSVGVVDPIDTTTVNGVASTTFRGISATDVGVPVIVTSGGVQDSILIQCTGTSTDTDGDGMPNAYETAHSCLDPSVADGAQDPDFDDYASVYEFLQGLDPCDADTDDDSRTDAADNCALVPNPAQTNTDVIVNPPGDVAGDACDANDDNDGCTDNAELGPNPVFGGDRDPLSPWDFFDAPVPAGPAVGANGQPILTLASVRNRTITLQDVGVVLSYVGRSSAVADYTADNNADGYADGAQLDRTPSANGAKPWQSGAPNGGVTIQDVGVVLAQVGHRCTTPS
jgi:hypothetical protein